MTDSEKKSHWQLLINLLGAKPREQEEKTPPLSAEPGSEGPDRPASAVPKPAGPKKKKSQSTERRLATNTRKHWGEVARSLGLESPLLPEAEEVEAEKEPEPEAEVISQTAPTIIPPAIESRKPVEPVSRRDYDEEAADVTSEEAEGVERGGPRVHDIEDKDRTRRTRRRGGRRRRRKSLSETGAEAEPFVAGDDGADETLAPLEEPEISFDRDDDEQIGTGEIKSEHRRRRRRRGRHDRDEAAEERPARRPRNIEAADVRTRDDRREQTEDEVEEESLVDKGVPRRAVPSWQEAIDFIVTANLASRQRSRDRDRDRGRGRGGKRGNDRGRR
jgi:hypothetical protein